MIVNETMKQKFKRFFLVPLWSSLYFFNRRLHHNLLIYKPIANSKQYLQSDLLEKLSSDSHVLCNFDFILQGRRRP